MKESLIHKYQAQYESYVGLTTTRETAIRYSQALENFFGRFTDKTDPEQFSKRDIEDFKIFRIRDGVSPTTVNYEVTVVKSFWNWLMRMDVTSYNPVTTSKRLKEKEPVKKSLTLEEQSKLYETSAAVGTIQDQLLVALALSTGLRAQTLVQLETSDCDFETSTLRIPAKKLKTGRNHEVPLRQDVIDLIRELPEGRLFDGYSSNAKSLSYRFNRLLRRSGCSLLGLRTGRRTFATTLLRANVNIDVVQALMGHRSVLTTSRYITRADEATVKAAIDKLPRPNPSSEETD